MSYSTYNRTTTIDEQFRTILTQQGFVNTTSAYFLNQLLTALKRAYKDQFSELYTIASQVDISRANGVFLERWGEVLAQPKTSASYASDMSLSNVRIQITPTATAHALTADTNGLSFPAGTILRDNASSVMVKLLDSAHIEPTATGVYVRVMATSPGVMTIPAGTLTIVDFPLQESGSIAGNSTTYALEVVQHADITGGSNTLDDDAYRYILEKKAQSWGLVNDDRFQTLMAIDDLVTVILKEVAGGVHVYLDTKHPAFDEMAIYIANAVVASFGVKGLHMAVFTPVYRPLSVKLQMTLAASGTVTYDKLERGAVIKTALNLKIANIPMGTTIDPYAMIATIANETAGIDTLSLVGMTYNGKPVIASQIPQQFNEKAQLPISGIVII